MKLINLTKKTTLTNNLIVANNWIQSSIGLLNKPPGTVMLFNTRFGIHTFGMRYPIDLFILNTKMKIVQIKKDLPPNRFYFWNPRYSYILEISTDFKAEAEINDILKIDL